MLLPRFADGNAGGVQLDEQDIARLSAIKAVISSTYQAPCHGTARSRGCMGLDIVSQRQVGLRQILCLSTDTISSRRSQDLVSTVVSTFCQNGRAVASIAQSKQRLIAHGDVCDQRAGLHAADDEVGCRAPCLRVVPRVHTQPLCSGYKSLPANIAKPCQTRLEFPSHSICLSLSFRTTRNRAGLRYSPLSQVNNKQRTTVMATERSLPSLNSHDHASSASRDLASSPSNIELISLVPTVNNAPSEQSWQSSATALSGTRYSTAHSTKINTTGLNEDPFTASVQPLLTHSDKTSVARRLFLDSWLCEIIAMSFSIGCLVAIVLVIRAFDGERIPQLISGLTLNTVISILSTASRASLIFVISAIIGQLKWCALKTSGRQIHDIQAMDDGSRGPLGAFRMLVLWTGGSLAALAGLVTLLTISFSPFLQQVVDYPSRNITQPGATASAPQNLAYTPSLPSRDPQLSVARAIEIGISSAPKPFDKEPECPTGQCSWPRFQSVGWCSQCEDHTALVTLSDCNLGSILQNESERSQHCLLDLGNGVKSPLLLTRTPDISTWPGTHVNYTEEVIWPISFGGDVQPTVVTSFGVIGEDIPSQPVGLPKMENTTYLGIPNPLMVFGHVAVEPTWDMSTAYEVEYDLLRVTKASQCILTLCDQYLSVPRVGGITTWIAHSTNYGNVFLHPTESESGYKICWQPEDGNVNLSFHDEQRDLVDRSKRAFCDVTAYAPYVAPYLIGQHNRSFVVSGSSQGPYKIHKTLGESRSSNTVGSQSTRSLRQRIESIANALTNYGLQTTNDTIRGYAYTEESYVRVRWQWLILPALLELVSVVLLILTIIYSRREDVPLWKSSILALMYHGVEGLRGQETLATERLSGMELIAKTTDVRLIKNEDGVNILSRRSGSRVVDEDK